MADSLHTDNLDGRQPTMREVMQFKARYLQTVDELSAMIRKMDQDYYTLRSDVAPYRRLLPIVPPSANAKPDDDGEIPKETSYTLCTHYLAHKVYGHGSWYGTLFSFQKSSAQDIQRALESLAEAPYDRSYRDTLIEELDQLRGSDQSRIVPEADMKLIREDIERLEADFFALQAKAKAVADAMRDDVNRHFPKRQKQ